MRPFNGTPEDHGGRGVPRTLLAMVDAYGREPMVDLDRPPPQRPTREPRERLRAGWRRMRTARLQVGAVALAAVVGAVAGGVGVHRWEARQAHAAEVSTVIVRAQLLDPSDLSGSSDGTDSTMVANLTLVNLGPLPIDVEDFEGERNGLVFRNASQQATIRPGFRTVAVSISFACARHTISGEPLPLRLRVRTADGQTRTIETPVEIGAKFWVQFLENLCRNSPS
ncbi:hypothetical protein [Asanoa ishikariensis]|uniref:hypothetical protein n=1 Tax=Asanoa ishikariensis TaxID=137265 RepID=UPI00115F9938|nr:hypothetical protein [Asanoa ishikariensis]